MAVLTSFSLLPTSTFPSLYSKPSPFSTPNRMNSRTTPLTLSSLSTTLSTIPIGHDLPLDYADHIPTRHPDHRRRAGVLLHPTSFPGPYGIGDLGHQAFRFIDWLHHSGCSLWQVCYRPISFFCLIMRKWGVNSCSIL